MNLTQKFVMTPVISMVLVVTIILMTSSLAHGQQGSTSMSFGDIICPNYQTRCSDSQTCCRTASGYGCCPYANATCCSDGKSCCPPGYDCDIAGRTCRRNSKTRSGKKGKGHRPWFRLDTQMSIMEAALIGNDIDATWDDPDNKFCPDGGICPDMSTCCPSDEGYGCCPVEGAVCCSDGLHCCPAGMTCNTAMGRCDH